jgi:hypothetical protein
MRALRELEPPEGDEGFSAIEQVAFAREPRPGGAGLFVAASALECLPPDLVGAGVPVLVFDWLPGGDTAELEQLASRLPAPAEVAVCPHPGGPPICWCRPPLPGLPLAFARRHDVDPARSTLVGTSSAHRTLATALGAELVSVG